MITNLEIAEGIAQKLRDESYRLWTNNCLTKSARFKSECEQQDIPARAVGCIGLARARFFGHWFTILAIHGWGEVEGKRIETSRPLGYSGIRGIVPSRIRKVIAVRFK